MGINDLKQFMNLIDAISLGLDMVNDLKTEYSKARGRDEVTIKELRTYRFTRDEEVRDLLRKKIEDG